jgi:CubicO group peptidase (beta-lactamase class C family)
LFHAPVVAADPPLAVPQSVGMSAEKLEQIKPLVQKAIDRGQTAGVVVLVARDGKIVALDALGSLDQKSGSAMRPDALFRIYSMTKPITSVAALILVEQGKLKLDEPVSTYLPELRGLKVYSESQSDPAAKGYEITVRDLMRHTSGFTYGMPGGTPVDQLYIDNNVEDGRYDSAAMVRKLGKLPLQYRPGTRFNYSVSTDVLGRVIEVVSGKPLDVFIHDRILRPLKMNDTGFEVPESKLYRLATSYAAPGNGTLQATDTAATSRFRGRPTFLSGGGGLVSTAYDYWRFCQMLLNGGELQGARILRPETVQEMVSNQLPPEALPMDLGGFKVPGLGFGLGVSVKLDTKSQSVDRTAGEFGWSGAASTFFWVAPKLKLVAIVLQQVEPLNIGLQFTLKPTIYAAIDK